VDGEVVGLGPPGGEEDLGRVGTDNRGEALPGLLQRGPGGSTGGVQAGGVADRSMAAQAAGVSGLVAA